MLSEFAGEATLKELVGGRLFVHEDRPEEYARDALDFLHSLPKGVCPSADFLNLDASALPTSRPGLTLLSSKLIFVARPSDDGLHEIFYEQRAQFV